MFVLQPKYFNFPEVYTHKDYSPSHLYLIDNGMIYNTRKKYNSCVHDFYYSEYVNQV